jgi:hypothetical protein
MSDQPSNIVPSQISTQRLLAELAQRAFNGLSGSAPRIRRFGQWVKETIQKNNPPVADRNKLTPYLQDTVQPAKTAVGARPIITTPITNNTTLRDELERLGKQVQWPEMVTIELSRGAILFIPKTQDRLNNLLGDLSPIIGASLAPPGRPSGRPGKTPAPPLGTMVLVTNELDHLVISGDQFFDQSGVDLSESNALDRGKFASAISAISTLCTEMVLKGIIPKCLMSPSNETLQALRRQVSLEISTVAKESPSRVEQALSQAIAAGQTKILEFVPTGLLPNKAAMAIFKASPDEFSRIPEDARNDIIAKNWSEWKPLIVESLTAPKVGLFGLGGDNENFKSKRAAVLKAIPNIFLDDREILGLLTVRQIAEVLRSRVTGDKNKDNPSEGLVDDTDARAINQPAEAAPSAPSLLSKTFEDEALGLNLNDLIEADQRAPAPNWTGAESNLEPTQDDPAILDKAVEIHMRG